MLEPRENLFIDLFAGCGGISLGLMKASWIGLFAIEKSDMAFQTLGHNLIDGDRVHYLDNLLSLLCKAALNA